MGQRMRGAVPPLFPRSFVARRSSKHRGSCVVIPFVAERMSLYGRVCREFIPATTTEPNPEPDEFTKHPVSLRSISVLFFHLCLGIRSDMFPSGFTANILYAFLSPHVCYMPCPPHPHQSSHTETVAAINCPITSSYCSDTRHSYWKSS